MIRTTSVTAVYAITYNLAESDNTTVGVVLCRLLVINGILLLLDRIVR